MSCPDWAGLARRRDEDPGSWEAALAHHDRCPDCRDAALEADPLLLFRRLPAPGLDRSEIDSVHRGVATLRRARSLEAEEPAPRRHLPWAAAAAALLGLLLTGAPSLDAPDATPTGPAGIVATSPGPGSPEATPATLAASARVLADLPVIEDLATTGPLVQVDGRDLTVVMVQRARPFGDV